MNSDTADREMVITRTVNAPRELVFDAFTDPSNIGQWWGPNGFTTTVYEMDVRPGGVWRYMMHGPDGTDYPNKVVYIDVVRPERLVYHHGSDGDVANDPHSFHVTITFVVVGGKTAVTMRAVFATAEQFAEVKKFGAVEGGEQNLARLEAYLSRKMAR
jgi:uncharacterized protein YndB with AHSA1/START domain